MKVLFVYMGAESLGVEYLAGAARAAGHEADLAFDPALFGGNLMWDIPTLARRLDLRPKIMKRISDERPEVAAFSCFTGNYLWALSIADEIKNMHPEIKTIFGGVHVTAVPEKVLREKAVDAIAVGESEHTFPAMLEALTNGAATVPPGARIKIDGGVRAGESPGLIEDLDTLPAPAKDLFYKKAPALQHHYMIMSARGCPYACTYCYKSLSQYAPPGKNPIRRRSVGNVISELEKATRDWNVKMVVFRDDVFTLNKVWLDDFAREYTKKIGLPYFCYTHPAALDAETADLIKNSGCRFVTIGIQSVDERQRRDVLNRRYSNEKVRASMQLLRERGIVVSADHIIGLPGDTREKLEAAAEFYTEIRPNRLLTFWLTYYPGTRIMQIAQDAGTVSAADVERIESGMSGHRYSGGGASGIPKEILGFPVLFALIPIIGPVLTRLLLKSGLFKILPKSFAVHNLLLAFNALRIGDPFFIYNIRFSISRKKVP
ncbi:MAG TPA: radical SAM protein [bacterium]|nr:radical SAM protein [bacterium]